jgi:hypothetical protein
MRSVDQRKPASAVLDALRALPWFPWPTVLSLSLTHTLTLTLSLSLSHTRLHTLSTGRTGGC